MTITKEGNKVADYFELEADSIDRHEYLNGEIREMPGGTPTHNQVLVNLTILFGGMLRGTPYQVFVADQRLAIPDRDVFTYPDLMVIEKPIGLFGGRKDTVINPVLIAEVLSTSTRGYDKDEKFMAYRTIPTFVEYLLIEQDTMNVQQSIKQSDKKWLMTEYCNPDDKIDLPSLQITIDLAELYYGIELGEEL